MEEVYEMLKKKLNWRERIVYTVFKKDLEKIYNITRTEIVNSMLK